MSRTKVEVVEKKAGKKPTKDEGMKALGDILSQAMDKNVSVSWSK